MASARPMARLISCEYEFFDDSRLFHKTADTLSLQHTMCGSVKSCCHCGPQHSTTSAIRKCSRTLIVNPDISDDWISAASSASKRIWMNSFAAGWSTARPASEASM